MLVIVMLVYWITDIENNHLQNTWTNFFNSLISANRYRVENGDLYDLDTRNTYFYNTLQLTYGLSGNSRFNAGFDINTIMGRIDEDRGSSLFKVFGSQGGGGSRYAKAITSIAPRIRFRPFKRNYRFTIQSSILFPTGISNEKESILGKNQIFFLSQFLYNWPLNQRLFLFSQLSIEYGFERTDAPPLFISPLSIYLSYLIPKKTILFILTNYVPVFTKADSWKYNQYTFQVGGGVQYQFSKRILINAYYTNDIAGKTYYDFAGYNLSARFLIH